MRLLRRMWRDQPVIMEYRHWLRNTAKFNFGLPSTYCIKQQQQISPATVCQRNCGSDSLTRLKMKSCYLNIFVWDWGGENAECCTPKISFILPSSISLKYVPIGPNTHTHNPADVDVVMYVYHKASATHGDWVKLTLVSWSGGAVIPLSLSTKVKAQKNASGSYRGEQARYCRYTADTSRCYSADL